MEFDEIKNLIELLKDTDITELKIERDGKKVKIKREKVISSFEVPPVVQPSPEVTKTGPEAKPEAESAAEQNLAEVTSPIVGIFYASTSPESPPFTNVGNKVRKGQVLCIVEAMKLMNEIECDTDGTVAKILVENGQPVEYGEPLFLIDRSS